ncbi:hypothetical protein [Asaia sp. HN010]|uniref:hypothetical protein n=1 Tax=Asaia sp. HN010 TaxID=3081233 RepID=UPI003016C908
MNSSRWDSEYRQLDVERHSTGYQHEAGYYDRSGRPKVIPEGGTGRRVIEANFWKSQVVKSLPFHLAGTMTL